jgi:hypothetical protein
MVSSVKIPGVYNDESFANDLDDKSSDEKVERPLKEGNGKPLKEGDGKPLNAQMVYVLRGKDVIPTREVKSSGRHSQAHCLEEIMKHTNGKSRSTIHVHPRTLPDRPIPEIMRRGRTKRDESLSAFLHEHRAAVIGGAIVRDISLLVGGVPQNNGEGQAKIQFADLPVVPFQVPESSGVRPQLHSCSDPSFLDNSKHILVFPEEYIAPPGFEGVKMLPLGELESLQRFVPKPLTKWRRHSSMCIRCLGTLSISGASRDLQQSCTNTRVR